MIIRDFGAPGGSLAFTLSAGISGIILLTLSLTAFRMLKVCDDFTVPSSGAVEGSNHLRFRGVTASADARLWFAFWYDRNVGRCVRPVTINDETLAVRSRTEKSL